MPVDPFTHNHRRHPIAHHFDALGYNDPDDARDLDVSPIDEPDVDDIAPDNNFYDLVSHIDEHGNDLTDWAAEHDYSPADHIDASAVVYAIGLYRDLVATIDALSPAQRDAYSRRVFATHA